MQRDTFIDKTTPLSTFFKKPNDNQGQRQNILKQQKGRKISIDSRLATPFKFSNVRRIFQLHNNQLPHIHDVRKSQNILMRVFLSRHPSILDSPKSNTLEVRSHGTSTAPQLETEGRLRTHFECCWRCPALADSTPRRNYSSQIPLFTRGSPHTAQTWSRLSLLLTSSYQYDTWCWHASAPVLRPMKALRQLRVQPRQRHHARNWRPLRC